MSPALHPIILVCVFQLGEGAYEYIETLDWPVEMMHERLIYRGRLDSDGHFIPDPEKPRRITAPYSGTTFRLLNPPSVPEVYELRSGRLIKGLLDIKGRFVPELGSRIISFDDYLKNYRKETPKIYNLPGFIVEKGSKEADQVRKRIEENRKRQEEMKKYMPPGSDREE